MMDDSVLLNREEFDRLLVFLKETDVYLKRWISFIEKKNGVER